MALGMLYFVCEKELFVPNSTRSNIDPFTTIRAGVINWQTTVWIQKQQSISADGKKWKILQQNQ